MHRKGWFAPLAGAMMLALLAVSAVSAGELCKAPEPSTLSGTAPAPTWLSGTVVTCTVNAWVVTNYYSDATKTTAVGQCHISCHQFDLGLAEPTFTSGGTCTGVSSSFTKQLTSPCPCPP